MDALNKGSLVTAKNQFHFQHCDQFRAAEKSDKRPQQVEQCWGNYRETKYDENDYLTGTNLGRVINR